MGQVYLTLLYNCGFTSGKLLGESCSYGKPERIWLPKPFAKSRWNPFVLQCLLLVDLILENVFYLHFCPCWVPRHVAELNSWVSLSPGAEQVVGLSWSPAVLWHLRAPRAYPEGLLLLCPGQTLQGLFSLQPEGHTLYETGPGSASFGLGMECGCHFSGWLPQEKAGFFFMVGRACQAAWEFRRRSGNQEELTARTLKMGPRTSEP